MRFVKRFVWLGAAAAAAVSMAVVAVTLLVFRHVQPETITDVSWPNCKVLPEPGGHEGIVGVTGGLDFHQNPCLSQETQWFSRYDLYANTGYPGMMSSRKFPNTPLACSTEDRACLAYNYGYHAAQYAVQYANSANAHAARWWLDVETENSWTEDQLVNRFALLGMVAGIKQSAFVTQIGFYTYPGQWKTIVGNWKMPLPAWVATGQKSMAGIAAQCRTPSFDSGPVRLVQYTPSLDQDLICPTADYANPLAIPASGFSSLHF